MPTEPSILMLQLLCGNISTAQILTVLNFIFIEGCQSLVCIEVLTILCKTQAANDGKGTQQFYIR
jgi:hypothetical protein